jgi:hypothetical protein
MKVALGCVAVRLAAFVMPCRLNGAFEDNDCGALLTIQQFNNSTINYFFSASTEMKHTLCRLTFARS